MKLGSGSRIIASNSCFAILLMPPSTRLPPRFWVTFYLRQPLALGNGFVEAMRVVGTAAAVTVGEGGGALLAVGRQQPAGVALADPQQLGGLGDGHLVFQNGVQHG